MAMAPCRPLHPVEQRPAHRRRTIRRWQRPVAAAAVLVTVLGASQGCVSVKPPRPCPLPCDEGRLGRASEVWVYTLDHRVVAVRDVVTYEDAGGSWIAGEAIDAEGEAAGPVRLRRDTVCALRTRRTEPRRVAANVALAPVVLLGMLVLDYWHIDDTEERPADEPWPEECT